MIGAVMKLNILFSREISDDLKEFVIKTLKEFFKKVEIQIVDFSINLDLFYNKLRRQVDLDKLISSLAAKIDNLFLMIISKDAYVPGLNFVFGVAIPYRGAIISTYRLKMTRDKNLFLIRLSKTIKHEMGHVFGLMHCKNYCVMRFANSLYELDKKSSEFCRRCYKKLEKIGVL